MLQVAYTCWWFIRHKSTILFIAGWIRRGFARLGRRELRAVVQDMAVWRKYYVGAVFPRRTRLPGIHALHVR